VFQNILNSQDLKGTIFIPTTKAWDKFFATMRQRQGNPAAPAMVTRYGQILLYHLAKVRNMPSCCSTFFLMERGKVCQADGSSGIPGKANTTFPRSSEGRHVLPPIDEAA
jgi:hypothetical protein